MNILYDKTISINKYLYVGGTLLIDFIAVVVLVIPFMFFILRRHLCAESWWLINTFRTLLHKENSLLLNKNLFLFARYVFLVVSGGNKGDWICQMSVASLGSSIHFGNRFDWILYSIAYSVYSLKTKKSRNLNHKKL